MFAIVISNAQPDTINKDNVYIVLEQFMFYNNINDAAIDTSLVKDTVLVQLDTEQILICDFTYTFDLNNNTIFKLSPIGIVSKQYKNIKRLKYKYYTDVEFASMLNLKIKEKLCQLRKDLITGNINKPLGNKKSLSATYDFTVLNDKINRAGDELTKFGNKFTISLVGSGVGYSLVVVGALFTVPVIVVVGSGLLLTASVIRIIAFYKIAKAGKILKE